MPKREPKSEAEAQEDSGHLPLAATCQICKNCEAYFPKDQKSCPSCGTAVA